MDFCFVHFLCVLFQCLVLIQVGAHPFKQQCIYLYTQEERSTKGAHTQTYQMKWSVRVQCIWNSVKCKEYEIQKKTERIHEQQKKKLPRYWNKAETKSYSKREKTSQNASECVCVYVRESLYNSNTTNNKNTNEKENIYFGSTTERKCKSNFVLSTTHSRTHKLFIGSIACCFIFNSSHAFHFLLFIHRPIFQPALYWSQSISSVNLTLNK